MSGRVLRSTTMSQRQVQDVNPTGSSIGRGMSGTKITKPGSVVKVVRVEKILGKRINNGRVEYFVKWKGNPMKESGWEPEEFLNCPNQIAMFEEECKLTVAMRERQSNINRKRKRSANTPNNSAFGALPSAPNPNPRPERAIANRPIGFARNLEPEQIFAANKNRDGLLWFIMKWKGSNEMDYVPAEIANARCPQVVIAYYETILSFH